MKRRTVIVRGEPVGLWVTDGARPAVLVHGAGGNGVSWAPVARRWDDAALFAPDLPGRDGTGGPASPDVADLADWLGDLIEALDLERPLVLGHSMGGAVALSLALRAPERLGRLVLVSSGARLGVAPRLLETLAAFDPDRPFPMAVAFGAPESEVARDYVRATSTVPGRTTRTDFEACDAFDVRGELGRVTLPTLVVYGADDALTPPRFQEKLVASLPDATSVVLAGHGHMLPWEGPERLVVAVRDWLGG